MRKPIRWLIVVAAVVTLGWLLRATVLAPEPIPVTTVAAERGVVESTATNSRAGTVKVERRAKLSPEIGGRVVALPFREGDAVPAGAVVLRLDDSLQRAQVTVAERERQAAAAEAERACLAAEQAARELARNQRLAADGIVASDQLDRLDSAARTGEAACRAARLNVERAAAAAGLARAELAKTVLVAPFAAIVAELSIELGEWTTPSPPAMPVPPVLDLIDPSSVYVSAPMDEVDSARIHAGQAARVTVDSYPGQSFSAQVRRVAPYVLDVEQQNRTVEVEVDLAPTGGGERLLPGTSADVEVILDRRSEVLRVPTQAIIDGRQVLVVDGERLVERAVETGLRNWDFTEITAGLADGDRVVISLDRDEIVAGALVEEEHDGPPGVGD